LLGGIAAIPVNSSGAAIDPRFYNKRSEINWLLVDWIKAGGCLPNDPELLAELTAPTYTYYKGKLLIEEKAQIKKRLGFSPDKMDALALTFALPEMPGSVVEGVHIPVGLGARASRAKTDYDPLVGD
jgi:hypothetical protein